MEILTDLCPALAAYSLVSLRVGKNNTDQWIKISGEEADDTNGVNRWVEELSCNPS